jgi:hypothetical protein
MMQNRSVLIGAVILAATAFAANAQQQYQTHAYPIQTYPHYQVPPFPPAAWNYNPYTSGMTACPQRGPRDPPCSETLFPTYGQPNYRR